MNKLFTAVSLFSAVFLFTGCENFKDKRFSTTLYANFEVDAAQGGSTVVDLNKEITSLINEQLDAVKDDIQSYELVGISYKVWEYYTDETGEDCLFNGIIGIGSPGSTEPEVFHTMENLSLLDAYTGEARTAIVFSANDIAKVQDFFMNSNGAKLYLGGDLSTVPVHFVLDIQVDIDAIAKIEE